jgi:hypothetical protein
MSTKKLNDELEREMNNTHTNTNTNTKLCTSPRPGGALAAAKDCDAAAFLKLNHSRNTLTAIA